MRKGVYCVSIGRIIESSECVAEGAEWLAKKDPKLAWALTQTGPLPLRRRSDGFRELLNSIVSQQLSVASADAIWTRMTSAQLITPRHIQQARDEDLRLVGLSRQKIRYVRALSSAQIDYVALRKLPNDAVIDTLTQVPGIGTWTAEIYAMFSLGRADVFASGDLALQESVRLLYERPVRPKPRELSDMAEQWSPWRAVAARLLWAYYRRAKGREGVRSS